MTDVTNQLNATRADCANLQSTLSALTAQCGQLEQTNVALVDQAQGLNATVVDLNTQLNGTRVELNHATVNLNQQANTIANLENVNHALNDNLTQAQGQGQVLEANNAQLTQDNYALNNQLNNGGVAMTNLRASTGPEVLLTGDA